MGKRYGRLPKKMIIPNPYNIPIHNQGNENNCTSHAFATMIEYKLSKILKERVLIEVDDLWTKQKGYGTAIDRGDTMEGVMFIADKYGMKFQTESGRKGIYRPRCNILFFNKE